MKKRRFASAALLVSAALFVGLAGAQTDDCTTVLARVDSKLARFAPNYAGAVLHAKTQRDKGAALCRTGESAQALTALGKAESVLDAMR